jgi:hypothetical protein
MKTVRLQRRHWQLAACVVGLIASAVPVVIWTSPFWGFSVSGEADGVPGIHVADVEAGSPADAIGLRPDDRIHGREGRSFRAEEFMARHWGLKPGEEVRVQAERGREEFEVTFRGVEPELAALVYWKWQPLAAVGFVALALAAWFAPRPRLRGGLDWFQLVALPIAVMLLALFLSGQFPAWERWRIRMETPRFTWRETLAFSAAMVSLMATLFELREAFAPRLRELYESITSEASVE